MKKNRKNEKYFFNEIVNNDNYSEKSFFNQTYDDQIEFFFSFEKI